MADLEELYKEIILDHYRSPRNRGELDSPPATRVEGYNPMCGDEFVLYLNLEDGVVRDLKLTGHGCSISQASSSIMSTALKGKTVDEARAIIDTFKRLLTVHEDGTVDDTPADLRKLGEMAALQGVVKFPARIKCATLAWNTFAQALDEATT